MRSNLIKTLVLAAVCLFAAAVNAQPLVQGSPPVPTTTGGHSEAYCSGLPGGYRVCRAQTLEGSAEFVLFNRNVKIGSVDAAWRTMAAEPKDFYAYRGDLDGNGAQEIVVVSLEHVTNGLGVSYSTVHLFDGLKLGTAASGPLSFDIQEFGPGENFIYRKNEGRTDILITYWSEYRSIEPNRPAGLYLVGKWFRFKDGRLEPLEGKPTLARRYLNSFAAERSNENFENRRPYTWLLDRTTHRLFREPEELSKPTGIVDAVITSFREPEVTFRTGSGEELRGIIGRSRGNDGEHKTLEVAAIGILRTRYTYPLSFSQRFNERAFFESLEGRRVRIEKYHPADYREFVKVYLVD